MSGGEGSQPISEGDNVDRDVMDTGGGASSPGVGDNSAGGGRGANSAGGGGADTAGIAGVAGRIDASGDTDNEVEVVRQIRHGTGAGVGANSAAKGKRYVSPIWDHFDKDPNDLKNAVCLHCGEKVSTY